MRKQYIALMVLKSDHALMKRVCALKQNRIVDVFHQMVIDELFKYPPIELQDIQDQIWTDAKLQAEHDFPNLNANAKKQYVSKLFAQNISFHVEKWVNGEK